MRSKGSVSSAAPGPSNQSRGCRSRALDTRRNRFVSCIVDGDVLSAEEAGERFSEGSDAWEEGRRLLGLAEQRKALGRHETRTEEVQRKEERALVRRSNGSICYGRCDLVPVNWWVLF